MNGMKTKSLWLNLPGWRFNGSRRRGWLFNGPFYQHGYLTAFCARFKLLEHVWNKDIEVFILMCWSACCAALRVLEFCPRLIVPFRSKVQFCVQKTRAWYLFVTGWQELFPHTSWALSVWLIHCSLHRANVWGFPTCAINQSTTW